MPDLSSLWTPGPSLLADAFAREGRELRLVGGPVRCALAGEVPKDEDLCTDATPLEMLRLGARLGLRTVPDLEHAERDPGLWSRGGLKHGTVPFVIGGATYDVTTLRVDAATDGRHAEVAFVRDFRADASRRDFTFNAMSVDREGRLHDHFGGADDLARGIVRFVGDPADRIREDYLRILRYYRFRARYGADGRRDPAVRAAEEAVAAAVSALAPGLARVSGERVWQEMSRMLSEPGGASQLRALRATGTAAAVGLPVQPGGLEAAERAAALGANPAVAVGLLLADTADGPGGPSGRGADALWRMGGEDAGLVEAARSMAGMREAPFGDFLDAAMEPRTRRDRIAAVLRGFGRAGDAARIEGPLPEFPVRGVALAAAGVMPGPGMGRAMAAMRSAWRESGYRAGEDELLAVLAPPPHSPPAPRP